MKPFEKDRHICMFNNPIEGKGICFSRIPGTLRFILVIVNIFFLIALLGACKKEKEEKDTQKPVINQSIEGAFPLNCDKLYLGDKYIFKILFTDNVELGSFSIDIHNNFDHHSHSTEVTECQSDPIKTPVNPFVFIQDYKIPAGLKEYVAILELDIPSQNTNGEIDAGDYHFFISLTDKSGWSAQKGLSIKILKH